MDLKYGTKEPLFIQKIQFENGVFNHVWEEITAFFCNPLEDKTEICEHRLHFASTALQRKDMMAPMCIQCSSVLFQS